MARPRVLSALAVSLLFADVLPAQPPEDDIAPFTWETLAERLSEEAEAGFTGAVLVVRDREVVLDAGYGLANRQHRIPVRPDTIFAVGSEPIDFTQAAILRLAQDGTISLADPITGFFDGVPEDKRGITLEHLMTGASGLRDFHDLPGDRDPDHSWIDRDEAMRRIFAQELLFPPGTGEEHSHSAWGVLAAIVEIASGSTYQEFTRRHVFEPAGMVDTGFNGDPVPEERLAIGYGPRSDGEINAPPYWGPTSWLVMGSGGQISTTRDISRFLTAMREGRILEPDWARRFFGPGVGASRNGDMYGFEMFVYHSPMAETHLVTLTNANDPGPEGGDDTRFIRVSRALGRFVLGPYLPRFRLGVAFGGVVDGALLVESVEPGSAAERDGLRAGDRLVAIAGGAIGDDWRAALDPHLRSGEPVAFRLLRGGEEIEVVVRPEPR